MDTNEDLLTKAIEQLKRAGLSQPVPKELLDETIKRLAECRPESGDAALRDRLHIANAPASRRGLFGPGLRWFAAAAALILAGYAAGRLSAPAPMDLEELRAALTPSIAASVEPVLRAKLSEDLKQQYQVALTSTYVRLKGELTQEYRDDLNRFAMQTLAASNATTNALLANLIQAIDTAQAQDRRSVALAISHIEAKRLQDRTQLATGLQTLAFRTEDELSRTKKVLARLLIDEIPPEVESPQELPRDTPNERSKE
jgi:hypothetical protein